MNPKLRGLYAITPTGLEETDLLQRSEQALSAGVAILQYRDKSRDHAKRLRQAQALRHMCEDHGALFIVNDDVDLAARCTADGVHLGADDVDIAAARHKLGKESIIGASCYDRMALATAAEQSGADYVAFGAVFPSSTKPNAVQSPLSLFTEAKHALRLPTCAIGGISPDNAKPIVQAGADMIAVVSSLFDSPDISTQAHRFRRLLT